LRARGSRDLRACDLDNGDDMNEKQGNEISPERAEEKERQASAFGSESEASSPGFSRTGGLHGDADKEAEADAKLRRRPPTIPGARIDRRTGKALTHPPSRGTGGWKRKGQIHPRQKGAVSPSTPSLADGPEFVEAVLGPRRIGVLRKSLARRGKPNAEETLARTYLGLLLKSLDSTMANKAAARLLLGSDGPKELRKLADLRRRPVSLKDQMRFEYDFMGDLARVVEARSKQR
jgi:hypothetical protein